MEISDTPEINMERMCRACMTNSGEMRSVFIESAINGEPLPKITDMIMAFTSVQVQENDGLPAQICLQCVSQVNSAYVFKQRCEQSDMAYRNYARKNNILPQDAMIKEENTSHEWSADNDYVIKPEVVMGDNVDEKSQNEFKDEKDIIEPKSESDSTLHICDDCGKTFTEARFLKRHMSVHNKISSKLYSKYNANKHKKYREKDTSDETKSKTFKRFECKECNVKFVREKNLVRHMRTAHKGHAKEKMKLRFSDEVVASSSEGEADFEPADECLVAVEEIIQETDLIEESKTTEEKIFKCKLCFKEFPKQKSYAAHMTKHIDPSTRGQKEFPCTVCEKVFNRRKNLSQHLFTHDKTKANKCNLCYRTFSRADQLALHMNNHTGLKRHVCPHCAKGFNMLSTLKDHLRTHSGEKPFLCSTCGKGFSQNTNLKQHVMRHNQTKPFKCPTCGYSFVSKGELDAHLRKHTGDHPFVCDVCGTGFTTSSSLVKHKRIHSGEKPYQCEFCPMRFTALGTLKNHRRTHTGEKPYACTFCERAFAQKSDLVSHTRTHTGERPYVCAICGHAFQQSSALKTHSKMHSSTGSAPSIGTVVPYMTTMQN